MFVYYICRLIIILRCALFCCFSNKILYWVVYIDDIGVSRWKENCVTVVNTANGSLLEILEVNRKY